MCGGLSRAPTGDLVCNPGMCPDWEWNQQPFGLQAIPQATPARAELALFELEDLLGESFFQFTISFVYSLSLTYFNHYHLFFP